MAKRPTYKALPAVESTEHAEALEGPLRRWLVVTRDPAGVMTALRAHHQHEAPTSMPLFQQGLPAHTRQWAWCREPHRAGYLIVSAEELGERYAKKNAWLDSKKDRLRRDAGRFRLTGVLHLAAPREPLNVLNIMERMTLIPIVPHFHVPLVRVECQSETDVGLAPLLAWDLAQALEAQLQVQAPRSTARL